MGRASRVPPSGFEKAVEFCSGVSIVPSSHLFSKQMMSHAPRAWWLETESYARILRASSAPFGRGSKNQKFSFLNFRFSAGGVGGIPPHPSEIKQRPAPPPCSVRAKPSKKVFCSFQKKKSGARKIRKAEKTFLLGGER
ncbi:hypothetical protein HYZ82_01445 [Candidatus Nomurabacteria bacterium]|nr:hypothetical protein [Candidatus Nomurabacteria bacterium]